VKRPNNSRWWLATPIRARLGLALVLGLAPLLILGAVQSLVNYNLMVKAREADLVAAAQRSAASVRSRILAGQVLLQTLSPGSVGVECAQRLAEIKDRLPGYENLIRFDSIGRVACAAAGAPSDPRRHARPWFKALAAGQTMAFTADPGVAYASTPALIASFRDEDAQGRFNGVLTAVLSLSSLRPERPISGAPAHSEVAIADSAGHYISSTNESAFPIKLGSRLSGEARSGPELWSGADRRGEGRIFTSAPLVGQDVFVLISAPNGALSWASISPIVAIALPLLAFALALAAVWTVADRGVVRWIAYLRRFAAIYARGRYGVHPFKAFEGPPEIRDLARTLDAMAGVIAARDRALKESLAEKDGLMREIHHRVKNNLQVISSLLNLQQRAMSDPAARAAMSDTRQRITALGLIYRALYQGADLRRVDLREFLEELIAHLVASESGGGAIETHLEIDPLTMDPDRLAPLALFAVEAITNAKKHGLGDTGARLSVTFKVRDTEAELCIRDSGRGDDAKMVGEGVGRTLMTAFARQMRGEVSFCAQPGEGLTARLVFPITVATGSEA
jgi:two-component sensor histidine kinase